MNDAARGLAERLRGALIPAVPVPFRRKGKDGSREPGSFERDEDAEAQLISYHAASRAAGVALWVHTGRGMLLSEVQLGDVFRHWRKGLRPEQFIICGAGCPVADLEGGVESLSDLAYIGRAVATARHAKALGADGLLVYAPTKFRGRPDQDEEILQYFQAMGEVGLPLILFYLYEAAGGVSYSLALLEKLLKLPQTAGIKVATLDSIMTFQDISNLIKQRAPEVTLLTGEDRFLGYTVMRGAAGALIGMGAVVPDLQEDLLASWRDKKAESFIQLSLALDAFAESTFIAPMEGYIRRIMIALALEGVLPMSSTHDPWGPEIAEPELERIRKALSVLKQLEQTIPGTPQDETNG